MTFFRNDNPTPPNGEQESSGPFNMPSSKGQPLFKQDNALPETLAGEHISLSAYISKHLHGGEDDDYEETENNLPTPESSKAKAAPWPLPLAENTNFPTPSRGVFLNTLDVNMPSGLESYLPSNTFRLRIAKKRIDGEIRELRQRINKYERLTTTSPGMPEQITLLRQRLASLEQHQQELRAQLSSNLGLLPMLYFFSRQSQGFGRWLNASLENLKQAIMALIFGKAYRNVQANGEELQALRELYAERQGSGTSTNGELSAILNRFEQVAQQADNDAHKLKPGSLPMRLWQEAKGLVK